MQTSPLNNVKPLLKGMAKHYRKWWLLYLIALPLTYCLLQKYTFGINVTKSLPGHFFIVVHGEMPKSKDDLFSFTWHAPKGFKAYQEGVTFAKIVAGMPGDEVKQDGKKITVGAWTVTARDYSTRTGMKLEQNKFEGKIPDDSYFAVGVHPNSLDSRYAMVGLIPKSDVIGVVHVLF